MSGLALEAVLRRDRLIVTAALAAVTMLAWAYTFWLAGQMDMGGMPVAAASDMKMGAMRMSALLAPAVRPWTGTDFAAMFVMWTVMMIGMMTPSAAPVILIYARVGRAAALQGKPLAATGFFAGGYLLAWTGFSVLATLGQWALTQAALLTPMMAAASDLVGGLVLIAAGLFQWTPIKDACLTYCQAPLGFIQQHGGFRREPLGSLRIGFRHGISCVGCCWALMALLFVGGVMNIVWIAALTAFVLLEKLVPIGRVISRTAGLGLVGWGIWLLASASQA